MTDSVDLPSAWLNQFDGTNLAAKLQVTAVLATVDESGWPHLAYLSAGEVLVHQPRRLSLALWPGSRSTANLRRLGQGVLYAAAEGAVWETKFVAKPRAIAEPLAVFDAEVIAVLRHAAPYAEVMSLIGFRLYDPAVTLERWRRQIEYLRAPASPAS